LAYAQVVAIKSDHRSSYEVARDYEISPSHAWSIQAGRAYADL
jgi:hypothetical protein